MNTLKIKKILTIIISVGIFGCLVLLIPQMRQLIIELIENFIIGRILEDHTRLHSFLLSFSLLVCGVLASFLIGVLYPKYWQNFIAKHNENQIVKIITEENTFLKWYDKQTTASKIGF